MITLSYPVPADYVGKISQSFGENPEIYKQFGIPGHDGIDWPVGNYTEISSAAYGTVVLIANDQPGWGLHIKITHWGTDGDEWTTLYAHLGNVKVVLHQTVEAGYLIALSDNTGFKPTNINNLIKFTTGPHLHFGLRDLSKRGNPYHGWVDPLPHFKAIPVPTPPAETPTTGKVIVGGLRLRSGPSQDYPITGGMSSGLVQVYDQATDAAGNLWYKVKVGSKVGWACAVYKLVYIEPVES